MMLRQIQHFQTVIQENSFTEAAELCHISQSGISRSIQSLEDEIGAKLIISSPLIILSVCSFYIFSRANILMFDICWWSLRQRSKLIHQSTHKRIAMFPFVYGKSLF